MTPLLLPLAALTLLGADAPVSRDVLLGETRVYRVRQTAKVDQIPAGAKSVRFWVAVPDDTRQQEVLDLSVVSAPGPWRFEHEPDRGNRFLYVEISDPKTSEIEVVVEYVMRRQPVLFEVQPEKVGEITSVHRRIYAEDLESSAPHMQVTPTILALANDTCGKDRNPATQARKLLDLVAQKADHYSKDPSKPKCGIGDAADCLTNGGGCCTDLHSLFIALARARGIPSRMQMGYRLLEKNEGKEVDPGYRCWVEYFLPGYGWMPADIVEADAADGEGPARWYSGLTERRVWLNSGREFVLNPRQALDHVNTMIIGYAEIDGRPARVLPEGELPAQLSRKILFTEIRGAGPTWLGAAEPPRTRPGEPKSASGTR